MYCEQYGTRAFVSTALGLLCTFSPVGSWAAVQIVVERTRGNEIAVRYEFSDERTAVDFRLDSSI